MAKKSNFLKNLLTTASILAISAGALEASATGDARTTTGTPALQNGTNLDKNAAKANVPFAPDSTLTFFSNHTFNAINGIPIAAVTVNANAISTVQAADGKAFSIGSVPRSLGTSGTLILKTGAADAVDITLTGVASNVSTYVNTAVPGNWAFTAAADDYSGLGKIIFENVNDKVIVASNTTLDATIDGIGANEGALVVDSANVTFNKVIGATNAIGALNVNAGKSATITKNATLNKINLAADAVLNVGAGTTITTPAIVGTSAKAAEGSLKFTGNVTAAVDKVGVVNKVNLVEIGAGAADFNKATVYNVTTTHLKDASSEIKFTNAAALDLNTDFTTENDGKGKITLSNGNRTFNGAIGTDTKRIAEINLTTADEIHFKKEDAKLYVKAITTTNVNKGQISFDANNIEIHSDIGTADRRFNTITLNSLTADPVTVKLMENKKISTAAAGGVNLSGAGDKNNILELYNKTTIDGNVYTGKAAKGIISVKGDATITEGIKIEAGNTIDRVRFDTANSLTLSKNVFNTTNGVDFKADGSLILNENADVDFNAQPTIVPVDATGVGTGSIKINNATAGKTLTFDVIGDVAVANTSLKLLEAKGGAKIELPQNVSIKKINIGDADSSIVLNKAGGQYLIKEFDHADNKGTLEIANDVTLMKGSSVSKDDKHLKMVHFTANKTLTLEDGVNLYTAYTAVGGVRNDGLGQGNLIFEGKSTVSGVVGLNNPFGNIQIKGKDSTVTFLNDVNISTDAKAPKSITISDKATAVFNSTIQAKNIQGDVDRHGTVQFNNKDNLVDGTAVNAAIGDVRLNTVELTGKNVTFNNVTFNTDNLKFTNDDVITATYTNVTAGSFTNTIITSSSNRKHNMIFSNEDQTFNNPVGNDGKAMGDLKLTGDNKFVFNGQFFGSVLTQTKGKAEVELRGFNSVAYALGSATEELKLITLKNNLTIKEGVWSKQINVDPAKTIKFEGIVSSSDKGVILGLDSIGDFTETDKLDAKVDGSADGYGTANFNDVEINQPLGSSHKLSTINFNGTAGDVAKVKSNLSANNINIGAQTFEVAGDITLAGITSITNGAVVNVGTNTVTLTGGNSNVSGKVTLNLGFVDKTTIGKVKIDGSLLTFANLNDLTLNINDTGARPVMPESYKILVIENGGTVNDISSAKVTSTQNRFVKWSVKGAELVRENDAPAELARRLKSSNSQLSTDGALYGSADISGDALKYSAELGRMDDATSVASLEKLTNQNAVHTADIAGQIASTTNLSVNNRITVVGASGVGAGEERKFGAWITPMYGTSTQKATGTNAGYRLKSVGGTIGIDTEANSDLTLGLAGSFVKTDVKYKGRAADKTKIDTYMLSIYGIQQLTDFWFMQGYASYATSKVKNSESRNLANNVTEIARGSFDTTSYSGELLAGYNIKMNEATVTPMLGASYININDGGYKETGTANQNLTIRKKSASKIDAIVGIRAQMTSNMSGMEITPEIHGFVRHSLLSKHAKVIAEHTGLANNFTPKSAKDQKTTYNLGIGVNTASGIYEYGVGYDLTMANKMIGHQGSLKIRLNF